jgi:hypothetical protein
VGSEDEIVKEGIYLLLWLACLIWFFYDCVKHPAPQDSEEKMEHAPGIEGIW